MLKICNMYPHLSQTMYPLCIATQATKHETSQLVISEGELTNIQGGGRIQSARVVDEAKRRTVKFTSVNSDWKTNRPTIQTCV